jgi:hypothetical protein
MGFHTNECGERCRSDNYIGVEGVGLLANTFCCKDIKNRNARKN